VIPNFTPPFPAYVSGHATFGAALCEVLKDFYRTDKIKFTLTSDELPGVTRTFTSFTQAAGENGRSRIYLGIHWQFDNTEGPALVRLKSSDVRIILGQHKGADGKPADNTRPIDVETWKFGQNDPYLRGYTIENIGSKNDKLRGDVLIGWFKPPAAGEHADEIYFMVTNGLSDRAGSAAQCRQRITLNLHFKESGIKGVQRLSRKSGKVEDVPLRAIEKDPGRYLMTLELEGGTGDLFKLDTGVAVVGM